jgi:hypothetical protein
MRDDKALGRDLSVIIHYDPKLAESRAVTINNDTHLRSYIYYDFGLPDGTCSGFCFGCHCEAVFLGPTKQPELLFCSILYLYKSVQIALLSRIDFARNDKPQVDFEQLPSPNSAAGHIKHPQLGESVQPHINGSRK